MELSFVTDEVSLVASVSFFVSVLFLGKGTARGALMGKEFVYFEGITSFSPSPLT